MVCGVCVCVQGLGTDDHTLVRVMVTRSEVDMEDIEEKFYKNYRKTLGSFIKVSLTFTVCMCTWKYMCAYWHSKLAFREKTERGKVR